MTVLQHQSAASLKQPPSGWKTKPVIYEINTWVWLRELSGKYGREITLAHVPPAEIEQLASWRFNAVWLMGVWHRGHATRMSALNYLHEYRHALPDITAADVPGSAYAIGDYQVETQLGGRQGLAIFREQLRRFGIKLILDFVPNHVATDHGWIFHHPEYFIRGTVDDAEKHPADFFRAETQDGKGAVIARGRDPYFPSWIDTAQLNAFHPGLRQAVIDTLIDIGSQCDGLRCDMAMLTMNTIFQQTWIGRATSMPELDYWQEIIPQVRERHPHLLFMAEVYWDLEHELQSQGFDYTYDKRLYDRLINHEVGEIKAHLSADLSYLRANIRFIENHDEARAMESMGVDRQRPAAALICTLPGAALLHQGQLSGRRIKLPVQINRQAEEPSHPLLTRFYLRLLNEVACSVYQDGDWNILEPTAVHAANHTFQILIAYSWHKGDDIRLVVINLSNEWSRCLLDISDWAHLDGKRWRLFDVLNEAFSLHEVDLMKSHNLTMEVPPYGASIFRFDLD